MVLVFCYIYLISGLVESLCSSYWTCEESFISAFLGGSVFKKGQESCGFMSSGFILAVIGAPLKLSKICVSFSLFSILSEIVFSVFASWCMLPGILSDNSVKPPVSMRLRSKRFVCLFEWFSCLFFLSFVLWEWSDVLLMVLEQDLLRSGVLRRLSYTEIFLSFHILKRGFNLRSPEFSLPLFVGSSL